MSTVAARMTAPTLANADTTATAATGNSHHSAVANTGGVAMATPAPAPAAGDGAPVSAATNHTAAPAAASAAATASGVDADARATASVTPATTGAAATVPAVTDTGSTARGTTGSATRTPVATTRPAPAHTATTTAHTGTAPAYPQPAGTAGSIGGALFALLLVVGLILALAWLARRMPGIGGRTNPALRVVGSLSLGPRERVVVVDVGGTQLLLGVGTGGTRTLHTLSQPLPVDTAGNTPGTLSAAPFAQLLAQHFGKKA